MKDFLIWTVDNVDTLTRWNIERLSDFGKLVKRCTYQFIKKIQNAVLLTAHCLALTSYRAHAFSVPLPVLPVALRYPTLPKACQ